jgi:hypothetical protein
MVIQFYYEQFSSWNNLKISFLTTTSPSKNVHSIYLFLPLALSFCLKPLSSNFQASPYLKLFQYLLPMW